MRGQHCVRPGQTLYPASEVYGFASEAVTDPPCLGPLGANQYKAAAKANLSMNARHGSEPGREVGATDGLDDRQRRTHGPFGIVAVSAREAKLEQYPIAC
ncbi:hypothetical protein MesoLj113b_29400 [Mesorhizobium sp. 113-3-3]|nr:hypothetical protein MesoLj113b_29400 [Mesorhizobium sp. 113-3-3]